MTDIKNIKKDFPFFQKNKNIVYLDNSATSLKPQCVIDNIINYYLKYSTNPHNTDFLLAYDCNENIQKIRKLVAEFINGKDSEIIFTPSTTFGLNQLALGLEALISKDDEILLTMAEHSSNLLPWYRLAKTKQAKIKYIGLEDLTITITNVKKLLTPKTKIVSFANISNVLGTVNDTKAICQAIKQYNPNIIVIIDGAQSVGHIKTDVQDWDIDFLVFSGHKMLGPTGIGILWGKNMMLSKLAPMLLGGGNNAIINENRTYSLVQGYMGFESGTQNIAGIFGLQEAIKYLQNIGLETIHNYITSLKDYAVNEIRRENLDVTIYNPNAKSGILVFNVNNVAAHDVSVNLANNHNICLRSGIHCASLIDQVLGVESSLRASFYIYNTKEDVDKLIIALKTGGNFIDDFL
ncbi:aminotransferase class V-fold PLP-dependent enzyme [Spiroplasma endosymbiont of Clivina fossor]|uniref:aminotransferase class V-fold PLP-dependent enzyme n=1 Tax=Spiroplasma endosymbiont of Clivina fossor TaxID=3066282 RepID=UPI00313C1949